MKPKEEARDRLSVRQGAYCRVFETGNPTPDDIHIVLQDLAQFCRANESTFHSDPRLAAMLDGRREVFLRIRDHLMLDTDALLFKYSNMRTR